MADNETIDNRLYEIAQSCATIKQFQQDMHNRLFVDGGGLLPNLYKAHLELEKKTDAKADTVTVTGLASDVTKLKERGIWQQGYAAGLGCAAAFGLKWLGSKVGLHF